MKSEKVSLPRFARSATTPPSLGDDVFYNSNNDSEINISKIYVPTASVSAYKSADGWTDYSTYITGYSF
ncbi:MAG: hypothetical protein J6C53_02380 [Clostridia bacterium]|nr:hypothetical protein [Clostridia bacterium]